LYRSASKILIVEALPSLTQIVEALPSLCQIAFGGNRAGTRAGERRSPSTR
jgi:hypothetical protein